MFLFNPKDCILVQSHFMIHYISRVTGPIIFSAWYLLFLTLPNPTSQNYGKQKTEHVLLSNRGKMLT